MFRNYESRNSTYNPTIIEAVQAAWATPGFLPPARLGNAPLLEELTSAINGFHNPTFEAIKEAHEIFGRERKISSVLSLGSGKRTSVSLPIAVQVAQETEITAENLQRRFGALGVYFRFSVEDEMLFDPVDIEGHFGSITTHTRKYIDGDAVNSSIDSYLKVSDHTSTVTLDRLCKYVRCPYTFILPLWVKAVRELGA